MIKFRIKTDSYEFDDEAMTIDEARLIKKHTGMGLKSWAMGLQDMDPDALVAMVYLSKVRAGEAVRWQDLDSLKLNDINLDVPEDDVDPPAQTTRTSSKSGRTPKG